MTLWTAAHQAPPSMGFSRQEYWSRLPLPSPTYDEQFEIISIGLVNLGANKRDQVVIQIFVCICLVVFKISSFSSHLYATSVPFCSRALGYICNFLFIYLWLRWVSSAAYGLSLVAARVGLLIVVASRAELGMWPQ